MSQILILLLWVACHGLAMEMPDASGVLKGQLVDRESGCPVAGVSVLPAEGAAPLAVSDADGGFWLRLPSGEHNLRFRHADYLETRWQTELPPGRVLARELPLDRSVAGTDTITIRGKRGHSLEETRHVLNQALATPTPTRAERDAQQWKPVAQVSNLALKLAGLAMLALCVWGWVAKG